ncbi:hypothetical protein QAD02_022410 [Eretmocerus hayati]|uniref:Uncharacterized protein n=1 Tax=Eretmocerus hayati TaxID=131215 RepID=A0ACC2PSY0_9HYME|nr:hypothetical protein QAD02_022410 [Eretmocerus hayati]
MLFTTAEFCTAVPIKGGNVKQVKENEFPFIVSLEGKPHIKSLIRSHYCGGTLISTTHVLTAAHCILSDDLMKREVEIRAGSPNLMSPNLKKFKPKRWIEYIHWAIVKGLPIHESLNDIAIITLDVDKTGIAYARSPLSHRTVSEGTNVLVAGWGLTDDNIIPSLLQKAYLRVISNEECSSQIIALDPKKKSHSISKNIMCYVAKPHILAVCGDSGNPVLDKNNYLIGMHIGRCPMGDFHPRQVNIAINISFYKTFLTDIISGSTYPLL